MHGPCMGGGRLRVRLIWAPLCARRVVEFRNQRLIETLAGKGVGLVRRASDGRPVTVEMDVASALAMFAGGAGLEEDCGGDVVRAASSVVYWCAGRRGDVECRDGG